MLGRALRALDGAAFRPASLPNWWVTAVALVPTVVAGSIIFGVPALLDLLLAIAIGGAVHLGARRLGLGISDSPVIAAVVALAFVGAGTTPLLAAAVALVGALLSLIRDRLLPGLRVQPGLLAFALVFILSAGGTSAYINPGSGRPLAEPIRLWEQTGAFLLDPTRLYVGNVPGPMFATSLLAVVIGGAWFWYARRLSLMVVLAGAAGALVPAVVLRWNAGYQLDSGPTWFAIALLLADRRLLPAANAVRPLLGLVAGGVVIALRSRGLGVEGAALTVVALQLLVGAFEGTEWLVVNRDLVGRRLNALRRETVRITRRRAA